MSNTGHRRPSRVWLVVGVLLSLALAAGSSMYLEPSYGGKTVTEWLYSTNPDIIFMPNDFYGHIHNELWEAVIEGGYGARRANTNSSARAGLPVTKDASEQAIERIGKAAVPRLLALISWKSGPGERLRWQLARHLPPKLGDWVMNSPLILDQRRCLIAAVDGFSILGTNAESALPALKDLLNAPNPCFEMGCAISAIGPKGRQLLVDALASTNAEARDVAAFCLGEDPGAEQLAMPALLRLVQRDEDSYQVMGAIGRLGGEAEITVPALVAYLQRHSDEKQSAWEPDMAILVLGEFGRQARACIPVLTKLYASANPLTRQVIRVTLHHIEPDESERLIGRPWNKADEEDPWWNGTKE